MLWVGAGDGAATSRCHPLKSSGSSKTFQASVHVEGFGVPFRVASVRIADGSNIYLGLSERDELRVLRNLRVRFLTLWLASVLLGFLIVFYATRRMLGHVREITEAASRIGQSDLSSRVPNTRGNDEVGHLARTLNHMLDRIENTVTQLHTITESLAHDLRSPLTAIRGKLETTLTEGLRVQDAESIVTAIDELDRLTNFLNMSLDVAEAKADALRLSRSTVDLERLVRDMAELYEPSMGERGIQMRVRSAGPVEISADPGLLHRVLANLLENELKHLPASCTVSFEIGSSEHDACLVVSDDGPGFDPSILAKAFEQRVKGKDSRGHGLGLAFVHAVVRAHGGEVEAANEASGGARITIRWPLSTLSAEEQRPPMPMVAQV